jgi:hypothetical protein
MKTSLAKKNILLLLLILTAATLAGIQSARADGCCCNGSWDPTGKCE